MRGLIVETDIGRDADDFFALCYLASKGIPIRAVTISPGDPDQIALAKWLLKELGLDVPVGAGQPNRSKSSVGGIHTKLMARYGAATTATADGMGADIIAEVLQAHPDTGTFAIGPLNSVGAFLKRNPGVHIPQATMQGGFIGYDVHGLPVERLKKFEGMTHVSTFNMGGDIPGALAFLEANIPDRRFVGKHLCHTIVYDREVHEKVMAVPPRGRADELLREGMSLYLERHPEGKKFHDPTAAVAHCHPEIGTWVYGKHTVEKGKWGAHLTGEGDLVMVDIDRVALWQHIADPSGVRVPA